MLFRGGIGLVLVLILFRLLFLVLLLLLIPLLVAVLVLEGEVVVDHCVLLDLSLEQRLVLLLVDVPVEFRGRLRDV